MSTASLDTLFKRYGLTVLLLGALTTTAQAQFSKNSHAQHTQHAANQKSSHMLEFNKQAMAALKPLRERAFDVKFAQLMIEHHQMAVDMSALPLKDGRNPQVMVMAEKVITAQQKEIKLLNTLLTQWTGKGHIVSSMPFVIKEDANRWYIREMIPHHQGAVDMSKLALIHSKTPAIKKLAQQIVSTQTKEINSYREWLKSQP